MDIFEKCYKYQDPKFVKKLGLYPYFHEISSSEGSVVKMNGKEIIMTGSNNYLGLTHDPRVQEAAKAAIDKYGAGCTGSRLLNGNLDLHVQIEKQMADFVGKEDALVFSTGFFANQGAIETICGKNDIIYSDNENHASIISGCSLSKATIKRYDHTNLSTLYKVLEETVHDDHGKFLVTDGVFSMTGHVAPLDKIVKAVKRLKIRVMVDDAHGLGVIGEQGRGTANHYGITKDVDLIMGTFSKSFGAIGGFVAGEADVIDYIRHRSRSLIFSASIPPAAAATVLQTLEIIKNEKERIEKLWENARFMREGLDEIGIDNLGSRSPINPILVKDDLISFQIAHDLFEKGIYVTPIIFPAVPKGKALIRTSVMATHNKKELTIVLEAFAEMAKKYKIDFKNQEDCSQNYQSEYTQQASAAV